MNYQIFKANIIFHLLFTFLISTQLTTAQNNDEYSLLWKIEGNNLESPSYLFGTMHIDDARVFNFSDAVMPAIESVEYFALEINPDSLMHAITNLKYDITANQYFKNLLEPNDYKRLLKRFKDVNNESLEDSEIMSPEAIISMLIPDINKEDDKPTFVDLHLLGHARTMGKKIVGLENIDDQLNYFDKLTDERKRKEISSNLDIDLDSINRTKEQMTTIYASGSLDKIAKFIEDFDVIDDVMIARNKVMSNSIINIMKKGSLFAGVGAAHLVGEDNVIALLQKEGYSVSVANAEFTGVADTYKIDNSKGLWHNFIDQDLGYYLEIPKAPNYEEDFDKFTFYGYGDIQTTTTYLFMAFDLGYTIEQTQADTFLENMISSILQSRDAEIISKHKMPDTDKDAYTVISKLPGGLKMKSRFVLKNSHFYYFSAETPANQIEENYISRFLNSITIDGVEKKAYISNWQEFKSEQGAFSVDIPVEAKDISREYPNPLDPEGEPYFMNLYMATDNTNKNNYLIRYNDMPSGYYLQDTEEAFKGTETSLTQTAKLISEPKIIYLDGFEGREYELLLADKYHSIARVYFRGNRTYLLLAQKLSETEKTTVNNSFFDSFTLLPYAEPELKSFEASNKDFKAVLFDDVTESIDSTRLVDSYILDSHDFSSKNPTTGGFYQYGYSNLEKYFKLISYKEILELYKENSLEANDSIIHEKYFVKNGDSIIQFSTKNKLDKNTKSQTFNRIWLNTNRIQLAKAFVNDEEVNSGITEQIFNSIKMKAVPSKTTLSESKAKYIIEDLKSTDSIIYNRALGAFNYYEFNAQELPILKKALNFPFADDKSETIKSKIIYEFTLINDEASLEFLKLYYNKPTTSDLLKTAILVAIPSIESEKSLALYNELLFSNPPTKEEAYDYNLFQPFNDSLSYALENYDKLLTLMPNPQYRKDIIYLGKNIYDSELDTDNIVELNYNKILEYLATDSEVYFNQALPEDGIDNYDYTSYNVMVAYLQSMNTIKSNDSVSNAITSKLINGKDDKWLRLLAITARVFNNQTISESVLNTYLEDKYFRFEIMEALFKINKSKEINKKYLKEKEFAKLSFYNYVGEDGGYPDEVIILKKIKKNDAEFYAVKFQYNDDDANETESYIGVVGPIEKISQNSKLKMYESHTYWDDYNDEWETKIESLITDL
ncbi:TraB/GumN family protein [Winogradskyella ludwigii]|uniref:TraB/GumN family protein n=1 Tax=Winogradskyella ludwigii TaxID=2686076 RepID=UPI0015C74A56|nr:TraB/GumN family protein [Winogradskyella ludwigii]